MGGVVDAIRTSVTGGRQGGTACPAPSPGSCSPAFCRRRSSRRRRPPQAARPGPQSSASRSVGTFDTNTGAGTWRLVPLTKGPLKADSGTISGSGKIVGRSLRNGQRVTLIEGGDTLLGKRGSFGISQNVTSTEVAPGISADIGTWRFHAGIGAYERVSGGGRFAAVAL